MYTVGSAETGSSGPAPDLLRANLVYLNTLTALGALGAHEDQAFRPDPDVPVFVYAANLPAREEFGANPGDASLLLLVEVARGLGKRGLEAAYIAGIHHLGPEHGTMTDWPDLDAFRTDYRRRDLRTLDETRAAHIRNAVAHAIAGGSFNPLEAAFWVPEDHESAPVQGARRAQRRGEKSMRRARLDAALAEILGPEKSDDGQPPA